MSDVSVVVWGLIEYRAGVLVSKDFVAVAHGGFHNVALKFDGSLTAWGLNQQRQCDVPAGNDFTAVAGGGYHSLALKFERSAIASGIGKYPEFDTPISKDYIAIARGVYHGIVYIGEPVVLLLLGMAAFVLYRGGRTAGPKLLGDAKK